MNIFDSTASIILAAKIQRRTSDSCKSLLFEKYNSDSPATMTEESLEELALLTPSARNGERVYRQSCRQCHGSNKVETKTFSNEKKDFVLLGKSPKKIISAVRKGTNGSHYMPQFTPERLSSQQLADLIAFIKSQNP